MMGLFSDLNWLNVFGLGSLSSRTCFEPDFLTFGKRFGTAAGNVGKVGEKVGSMRIGCDETKPFGIVEPFDCTCFHRGIP